MGKPLHEIIPEMLPLFSYGNKGSANDKSSRSRTSLCAMLFNGGCLIGSDMQETHGTERPWRSSVRERKVYRIGGDDILLAGTGSSAGIIAAARRASQVIGYWKSEHDLEPIPPREVGEILSKIMNPEDEAQFLLAGFDRYRQQGLIAKIFDNGCFAQSHFVEVNGSGSPYMLAKARTVEQKALSTVDRSIVVTSDIYDALPTLKFSRQIAMLEGLDIIYAGPQNDVFSGGEGFQLAVLDNTGVTEYIIPKAIATEILSHKYNAEHAALNEEASATPVKKYKKLFEQCKQPTATWWIQ